MNLCKPMTALALAFVFCACGAQAQDQQQSPDNNTPQAPIAPVTPEDTGSTNLNQPPAAAGVVIGGSNSAVVDTTIQPGSEAVAGAVTSGIVSPTGGVNVLDPAIHVSVGPDNGVVPGQINTDILLGGTLAFDHFWLRNEFTTMYSGGYDVYEPATGNDSEYQILSISDVTQHQRVTLRFRDDFSDSAGSVFGGLNVGGPAISTPTGFITSLTPNFTVAQTILTSNATRIANSTLGEFDYALTRHATLTFAGTYEILHFLTSGYVDSSYYDGRVGYSFQLDRKNAIGLTYDYNYTSFGGITGAVASQTAEFAYALKFTGRMALQFAGGPQYIYTQNIGSSSTGQLGWSLSSTLSYRQRRTSYSANYSHGLTGGSGVYLGALSDTVTGSVQTITHRVWTPSVTGGYSNNSTLSVDTSTSSSYANWFATASLGRIWGRTLRTTASYALQEQTSDSTCPVASCGSSGLRQIFTITLDWHPRPIDLQ